MGMDGSNPTGLLNEFGDDTGADSGEFCMEDIGVREGEDTASEGKVRSRRVDRMTAGTSSEARWRVYMLPGECTRLQVKEAVYLADKLKDGPFDRDGFNKKLTEVKNKLRSLSEIGIEEAHFKDQHDRLRRINEGNWMLGIVGLENCLTWPHFGSWKSVEAGPVDVTAEKVRNHLEPDDRLQEIVTHVHLFFLNLPLVVIRTNKHPAKFFIDDGTHRAVAYYLAGFREALAYIGVVREDINHKWDWLAWKT